jgi:signal transduction histidine kinase
MPPDGPRPLFLQALHHQAIADRAASILAGPDDRIVDLSPGALPLLGQAAGGSGAAPARGRREAKTPRPVTHMSILDCLPDDLRSDVVDAVGRARRTGQPVRRTGLTVKIGSRSSQTDVVVSPIRLSTTEVGDEAPPVADPPANGADNEDDEGTDGSDAADSEREDGAAVPSTGQQDEIGGRLPATPRAGDTYLHIWFELRGSGVTPGETASGFLAPDAESTARQDGSGEAVGEEEPAPAAADATRSTTLREHIRRTQERLTKILQRHRSAQAEMIEATEELLEANDELQVRNERLNRSRERLREVNDRLSGSNRALNAMVAELQDDIAALENLMTAARIPTLFFDRSLQLDRFTDEAASSLNLSNGDLGTSIEDLALPFGANGQLADDAARVLENLTPVEREVDFKGATSAWYLARLHPYRSAGGDIDGVVLTLVDVTERRQLERELVDAAERVRRSIGQDLHDIVSADLVALAMKAEILVERLEAGDDADPAAVADEISQIAGGARDSASTARSLSYTLIPAGLQEEHLAAALSNICSCEDAVSGLACTFEGSRDEPLPESKEVAVYLYRIAHEAVVNARKHAGADQVWVSLVRRAGALVLEVEDDGAGPPDEHGFEMGLGLRLMHYRAGLIGASLLVSEGTRGGTLVRCRLPLDRAMAASDLEKP